MSVLAKAEEARSISHSTCLRVAALPTAEDGVDRNPEPHQRDAMARRSCKTTTVELIFVLGNVNQAISCIAQFPITQIGPKPDRQSRYGVAQATYA